MYKVYKGCGKCAVSLTQSSIKKIFFCISSIYQMKSEKCIAKWHMCRLFYRSFRISFIRNNDISAVTLTTSTHTHTFLLLSIQCNFPGIAVLGPKIFQGNQFFVTLGGKFCEHIQISQQKGNSFFNLMYWPV